jgi:hypothetical protein
MNAKRLGLLCALVACMAAEANAQMGMYGSPDLISLGQNPPQYAPAPVGQYTPAPAGQYVQQYAPAPAGQYVQQYAPPPAGQYVQQYAPASYAQYAPQTSQSAAAQYVQVPAGQYAQAYSPTPPAQYVPQYTPDAAGQYAPQPAPARPYVPQYAPAPVPAGQYVPQYAPPPAGQNPPQAAPAPVGQFVPRYAVAPAPNRTQYAYAPAVASRPPYLAPQDGPGPTLVPTPNPSVPQPPQAGLPQPPAFNNPQPSPESSAVSNMLAEPNGMVMNPQGGGVMQPGGYMRNAGNCEGCNGGCGGCESGCGGCGCGCGCGCCSPWFFSAEALYMGRNSPNNVYTSAEASNVNVQGLYNEYSWTPGAQATFGYRFGCCCEWSVAATYWGLAEASSCGGPGIPGPYVSPFTFGLTDILGTTGGGGTNGDQTANNFTDNSPNHYTWLNYQAQDAEITLSRTLCGGDCNCLSVDILGGFRWFRFQDGLVWGSQRANDGSAYANDWLYLNDHITNDLLGGQIGFNASYRFCNCWKLFITPMVGLYDNHMTLDYNLYAVVNNQQLQASSQSYSNPNYPVHTCSDGFAVLTQVDLGLDWQISCHVGAQIGYRLVAATDIGLSDNQIPSYANDTQAIGNIQHNGDLILHGAFAGLTFMW